MSAHSRSEQGVVVQVRPGTRQLRVAAGQRLLDAMDEVEPGLLPIACRGANCGSCAVRVVSGAMLLEPATQLERQRLVSLGAAADQRLGCQLQVRANAGEVVLASLPLNTS